MGAEKNVEFNQMRSQYGPSNFHSLRILAVQALHNIDAEDELSFEFGSSYSFTT